MSNTNLNQSDDNNSEPKNEARKGALRKWIDFTLTSIGYIIQSIILGLLLVILYVAIFGGGNGQAEAIDALKTIGIWLLFLLFMKFFAYCVPALVFFITVIVDALKMKCKGCK